MGEKKRHKIFFSKIEKFFDWITDIYVRITDYHNLAGKHKEGIDRIKGLYIRNRSLESNLISSQEDRTYLQRQIELKERKLISLQENQEHLKREREKLVVVKNKEIIGLQTDVVYAQRNVEKKTEKLLEIRYDVENAWEVCHDVRTGEDFIRERVEENRSSNKALTEWLEGPKIALENVVELLSKQSDIFQGFAFGGRVNTFINQNPRAKKIPISFYDFKNKEFCYNHSAANLLKFKPEGSHLSLGKLLRIIKNESYECDNKKLNTKRKFLLNSLKQGDILNSFEINTADKKPRKIYLTTRLINYYSKVGGVTEKKHFGILMFFNKPSMLLWGRRKEDKIYEQVQEVLDNLKKEFEPIYESVKYIR